MYVHEWGRRDDVPLVFWHALGADASGAELREVAPVLADAGFHVLAVDGPGFGRSPALSAERYRLAALAELLGELIDEREFERPVLMGHSWGGAIVVKYAGARPDDVRALVLLDSGHIDYGALPGTAAQLAASPPSDAGSMARHGLADPVSDAWPAIAAHEIPTLLFLATLPPHVDQNREHIGRFESAIPHADVRWPANAGHGLLADIGPPLGDEIAGWLVEQGL
ncbi:MAG: alpha/beta fold hydrolase [Gaiellaceae bacterium]